MKSENKVKKLVLRKETLRDLTAQDADEVKGAGWTAVLGTCYCHDKTYGTKCFPTRKGKQCH